MKIKLSRREFAKAATMGVAALATGACSTRLSSPAGGQGSPKSAAPQKTHLRKQQKPNLLFIWTDEQRADTMAAYGNHKIHTPNLNKLAKESVVFENAYVTQPVCTPNRSAVMTGLWPHKSGCIKNNIPLPLDIPCLPELLDDADYRTAYMGKWHLGDEIFAQHGFEEWVSIEDGYKRYYRDGRDRTRKSDYYHFLIEHGYKPDSGDGVFSRSFAARRRLEHCKPKFLEMKACDFLRRHRKEPFVLYINFLEPHMPFFGPLDDEHNPQKIDLPSNFNDPLEENEPLRYRLIREYCRAKYGKDEKDIRGLIARYWGLVTQVDLSVGAILKTLDDLGLTDNTIVVYTSDHGDMMGSHHMVEKSVMYAEAVKVPWLMRIPQMQGRGSLFKNLVSQIDTVPTLLDLLGRGFDGRFPGQSLVPLIKGGRVVLGTPYGGQDHVFIEWNPNSGALKVKRGGTQLAPKEELRRVKNEHTRAVLSPDGWKLCLSDADKCQLFDLNKDPGETVNLFDSGRHDEIISRLTMLIHKWQESVGDKVIV